MEFLFLLVPVVTTAIMQGVKRLARLYNSHNDPSQKTWLRTVLIVVSFFGLVAASIANGIELDANTVSDVVKTVIGTAVSAYLSHAAYRSMSKA